MGVKNSAQESIQKSLGMISLVFSVFKFKLKPTTKPIQILLELCALKAPKGSGGHDQAFWGSSWPEPHHECCCFQLCYHTRNACLAMCSMVWTLTRAWHVWSSDLAHHQDIASSSGLMAEPDHHLQPAQLLSLDVLQWNTGEWSSCPGDLGLWGPVTPCCTLTN